ncbi:MAG: sugar phosphate isomerase/epimerase family protein [Planctomycetota bacterium]|nr:sugar phosphate isomerase/epimerase family protein [Planctomycetota bacterium]
MNRLHRREFICAGATLLAASTIGVSGLLPTASAIEPIQRPGPPKFKFSLAAYSYRSLLKAKPGQAAELTLSDFVKDCAAMQLDGTELTSYYFAPDVSDDDLRKLKAECFRLGLDVSGTAIGNNFCLPPGEERDKQIANAKRWIERAAVLGAPVIRIFSGNAGPGQDVAAAHKLAVQGMEECCEYAGKHGVYLALENHGGLTATAQGMLKLVHDVKSPWFGVNLDSGNFHGNDAYGDLRQIAPYALNVQVKVLIKYDGGKRKVPSDFKRLAGILKESGYRGYVVLEYEESPDPRIECPRYMKQLREAFA